MFGLIMHQSVLIQKSPYISLQTITFLNIASYVSHSLYRQLSQSTIFLVDFL